MMRLLKKKKKKTFLFLTASQMLKFLLLTTPKYLPQLENRTQGTQELKGQPDYCKQ